MGDNIFPELGDLIFSVLIGYAGALEFIFVLRHLYHWSCSHANTIKSDAESLKKLQERMRSDLAEAEAKEFQAGTAVMKDGILYKDGFRIESEQLTQTTSESKEKRKKGLAIELKRQQDIEEETRRKLADVEAQLAEQRQQTAKALVTRQNQDKEKKVAKLAAVECARKEQQAKKEEEMRKEEELKSRLEEAYKPLDNEELQRQHSRSAKEEDCSLEKGEKEEEEQCQREKEAAESPKLFEVERKQEQKLREREIEQKTIESGLISIEEDTKPCETKEAEILDSIKRLLDDENYQFDETASQERSEKLRICGENARKFLEVDKEMAELLESVQNIGRNSAIESAPQSSVFEEPCIMKNISPLSDISDCVAGRFTQILKTQFGQASNGPYLLATRPLPFESISDDTQFYEHQSSEEYGTSSEAACDNPVDFKYTQLERQEPDGGEDNESRAATKYTDDYLRSLDGIKQRPLIREDWSGRRRAFKKRRSSGSSNSSFESRTSREEEIKMFTSLEEEELLPKKEGEDNFTPITYSTQPLLKVKIPRRRFKRSPAKDDKINEENTLSSVDMLEEEANKNPWGEITPEHYKNTPFWKREKSMSIDEEAIELELSLTKADSETDGNVPNFPKTLTFDTATHSQNEKALAQLRREQIKEVQKMEQRPADESSSGTQPNTVEKT